jgi:hypothetical protein
MCCEGVQDAVAAQLATRHSQGSVELMQMPPDSILDAGALSDQILAVIDQQLHLPGRGRRARRPGGRSGAAWPAPPPPASREEAEQHS